ncbi:sigma-54-dependent transcriptional regulator [Aneurinibacillus terranovensis]|uniref:sigma-54-dependent transcriptional regulator n=1 Tax=Aneurinibacillus terranovensis TaxID=278991 RepID=UPI000404D392|nr:sigma-54 dependent transcriptional regulator [Aneurinibacillus terranovensis]
MHSERNILIVDDEPKFRQLLSSRLTRKGYRVEEAGNGLEALECLNRQTIDLILLDLKMPDMDGMAFLEIYKQKPFSAEVIVLTGHGTIETAIEAMKYGAFDYITKPYNLKDLEIIIQNAFNKAESPETEDHSNMEEAPIQEERTSVIAESAVMKELILAAERVARTDSPILLTGESGTGKDLMARYIFENSTRKNQPFIPINMGAIAEMMLESELFGHEKGAFTGAVSQKKGLVELADTGTLFMDEIGDMPYPLQVKLLRFLESGEFRRVGSNTLRRVNVRIIAATNVNIEQKVVDGEFRADLYYRLNVVDLTIPPLRERRQDILPLAHFFLQKLTRHMGPKVLAEETKQALMVYQYPGNVRELAHIIERAIILSPGTTIHVKDLFLGKVRWDVSSQAPEIVQVREIRLDESGQESSYSLKEMEKHHIERVLHMVNWNKTRAAEQLGISVRNLYRKIEEYELKQ